MRPFVLRAMLALAVLAIPLTIFAFRRAGAANVDRVAEARKNVDAPLRRAFAARGLAYPPRTLFLRAFKAEKRLEMWGEGAEGRFEKVKTYSICESSGVLGPKRTQGDEQVPEGLYEVSVWNPKSRYHLSLGIDYPNASDRALGRAPFGGDIMIHGGCASVGCIPIGDAAIEEVYVASRDARDAGRRVVVHVFPVVMTDDGMRALERPSRGDAKLAAFWQSLRPAFAAFESTHKLPRTHVDRATGLYVVERPTP